MAYSFYRTVTIDHTKVPSTQTDFPVPIAGTLTYLKTVGNGGSVQNANGYDIQFFSDAALTTPLKFERTVYVASTGQVAFYVKVPSLSSSVDTVIYMAYGNAAISTDQSDAVNVWDANFIAVYHFGDGTTLSVLDSTTNAATLTNVGTVTTGSGPVDGVATMNGTTQYLKRSSAVATAVPGTFEALFNPSSLAATSNAVVTVANSALSGFIWSLVARTTGVMRFQTGTIVADTAAGAVTASTWNYAAGVVVSDSNRTVYANTATPVNVLTTTAAYNTPDNLVVGALGNSGTHAQFFPGSIGEVRVSNIARSANWITTTYNSLIGIATFYAIGTQQSPAAPSTILTTNAPAEVTSGVAISPAIVAKATTDGVTIDTSFTGDCVVTVATGIGTLTNATVACVAGVATFTNLAIAGDGAGYTLTFTMSGYTAVTSSAFLVIGTATAANRAFVDANGGASACLGFYDRRLGLTVVSGKVSAIADALGAYNGRTAGPDIVQATAGVRPALSGTQGSGSERITGDGTQYMASAVSAAFELATNRQIWMYAGFKGTANGVYVGLAADPTSDTTYPNVCLLGAGGSHAAQINTTGASKYASTMNQTLDSTRRVGYLGHDINVYSNFDVLWMHGQAGRQYRSKNGVTAATAGSTAVSLFKIGALGIGTGEFDFLYITNQTPSAALDRAVYAYAAAQHGATIASDKRGTIVFARESVGVGSQGSDPMTPADGTGTTSPSYLALHDARNVFSAFDIANIHGVNKCASGDNFNRALTDFSRQLARMDDGCRSGPHIYVFCGIGNCVKTLAASGLHTLADMKTGMIALKAAVGALHNGTGKLIWETELDSAGGPNGSNANATGWHLSAPGGAISAYGQIVYDLHAWMRDPATYSLSGHYPPIDYCTRDARYSITLTPPNPVETYDPLIYNGHLSDFGYTTMATMTVDYFAGNPSLLTGGTLRRHRRAGGVAGGRQ